MISEEWLWWLGISSIVIFVVSLATLPWLVAQIPENYFCHNRRTPTVWKKRHPAIRIILLILKNLLGIVLLVGGFIMLFIPGQGLLTMIMGIVLLDYPGKYALERKVASISAIHSGLNWLREKRHAPPLILDEKD